MTTTKARKPACYAAPIRGRKKQLEWLLAHETHYDDSDRKRYLSWNVKLYSVDLGFDHLLKVYKTKHCTVQTATGTEQKIPRQYTDEKWLALAREKYDEIKDNLFEWAVEDTRRSLIEGYGYQCLWNGTEFKVEYGFIGRSGGHLVITSFGGGSFVSAISLDQDTLIDIQDNDSLTTKQVSDLYQFVVQCDHDFRRQNAEDEVEYNAAFALFENCCNDLPLDPLPQEDTGVNI